MPEVASAIVAQLSAPEWGGASPLATASRMAGRWEVGEDAGLLALAKAVERELAVHAGKAVISFTVTPARGRPFAVEGREGMSLKDVSEHGEGEGAEMLAEYLECACSGVMACSTCHVYVDEPWADVLGAPSEEEEDMLDLAYERRDMSRLGCQLVLRRELEGIHVTLPGGANNLFDHIPFEGAPR